ncbi:uncharacterized protein LOC135385124 [Ornithodoros turicata]|uniref:uncharacterized protein LOC135385124 n=1 Tax=Ornithodoros turicata TaxID=34597 RepID=UPI0031393DDB
MTEAFWKPVLGHLRSLKEPSSGCHGNKLVVMGDVHVPPAVKDVLEKGQKFCVQPRVQAPDAVSWVRLLARRVEEGQCDRCVQEGVDLLDRTSVREGVKVGVAPVMDFFKNANVALLPSDKEGGFAVMPRTAYEERKARAIDKNFVGVKSTAVRDARKRMVVLCEEQELKVLSNSMKKRTQVALEIFFSAKTHKPECPLRAIVSERGTWQGVVSRFLQQHLSCMDLPDPFMVRSSAEVIDVVKGMENVGVRLMSIDIEDLYYSIPHEPLFRATRDRIEAYGRVKFQNSCGTTVEGFLELIRCYLSSTIVTDGSDSYVQRKGICIGSSVAPVLSDNFLTDLDVQLSTVLPSMGVRSALRYVDDYLVVLSLEASEGVDVDLDFARRIMDAFHRGGSGLRFTCEVAVEGVLRFLDLSLSAQRELLCWCYAPRSRKALLPYDSAHSKIVKRGIVKSCLGAALQKSCCHKVVEAYNRQCERIREAGYPQCVLRSVCVTLLREWKGSPGEMQDEEGRRGRYMVMSYIHVVSHNLKKLGDRYGVRVLFSAPFKLKSLSAKVNGQERRPSRSSLSDPSLMRQSLYRAIWKVCQCQVDGARGITEWHSARTPRCTL